MLSNSNSQSVQLVDEWLTNVVIGLNLCPFAKKPYKQNQIRYAEITETSQAALTEALHDELTRLENSKESEIETSVLIITQQLSDFYEYNEFLEIADDLIDNNGWRGVFQIASFHPDYQFAGTAPSDKENLTNRAPFPLLHLIRESSLDKAVDAHPDVDSIPEQNIIKMNQLTKQQIAELFHYLMD